ncbi:MAG: PspC domain-containing protein [Nocardioides sp.]|uniref:ATP-binding protein n=1 Tax=Nocardioides sp. TaxID=35761 RepID=UPI003F0C9088
MSTALPPPPPRPHPGLPPGADAPWQPRRMYRDLNHAVVGGVAAGLSEHLRVPLLWVRALFVATALLSGFGIALYAGLWIFVPSAPRDAQEAPGLASATRGGRRPGARSVLSDAGPAIALGALMLGLVIAVQSVLGSGILFWPVVLGLTGLALLWRQADEAQRERWLDTSGKLDPLSAVFGSGGWAAYARVGAGLGLVAVALAVFAIRSGPVTAAWPVMVAGLLGVAGLALVGGPWVVRLVRDLGDERAERVRSQERADVAAHLHDSVLQTLALIQKNAHDPTTVARLARAQERDLRTWLFETDPADDTTLAGALRDLAARVETDHPVTVDVVVVGDAPLDERLRPVSEAAGEAVVNAAKHAGVGRVDVYAEVGAEVVEVFVRDRGAGFDLDTVASDRRGVRGSIIDRMERHGGTAVIRSAPGEGTEVRLKMPLSQEENRG